MTVITPTVGRIVWYWPRVNDGEPISEQPFAAIVTYVFNDRMINLAAFDHVGNAERHISVQLVQEGDAVPGLGDYAQWMPYQIGQAKKHESVTQSGEAA